MIISPAGNRKLMIAQQVADPRLLQKDGSPIDDSIDTQGINPEDVKLLDQKNGPPSKDTLSQDTEIIDRNKPDESVQEEQKAQQEEAQASQDQSLTGYLFKKLQTFGYPGRRLMEFKDKFVVQNINPDGQKDVQVIIPNTYYGKGQQLSDEDFRSILKEVKHKFQLNFNGAKSEGGKCTITFTSINMNANPEEAPVEDELTNVYGPSDSKSKDKTKSSNKPARKAASSMQELIKANKDVMIDELLKLLAERVK